MQLVVAGRSMTIRFIWSLLGCAAISLTGCYETDSAIISEGERAPLAGRFDCKQSMDRVREYTEFKTELDTPSYSYFNDKGEIVYLKKVIDNLYIAQIIGSSHVKEGKVLYIFMEFRADGFVHLYPYLDDQPSLKALTEQHRVKITPGAVAALAGSNADILRFLMGHDRTKLEQVGECVRKGA